MDINRETTVIKIYSSETTVFDLKHGRCRHTWQCKQVLCDPDQPNSALTKEVLENGNEVTTKSTQ